MLDRCPRCLNKWNLINPSTDWSQCYPCKLNYYDSLMYGYILTIKFDQFELQWSWKFDDCSIHELGIFGLPWYPFDITYKQVKNTLAFI